MLLIESRPDEFLVVGSGLTVKMTRDPDADTKTGGMAGIEEVQRGGAEWAVSARLNGDQGDRGRRLTMDPRRRSDAFFACTCTEPSVTQTKKSFLFFHFQWPRMFNPESPLSPFYRQR